MVKFPTNFFWDGDRNRNPTGMSSFDRTSRGVLQHEDGKHNNFLRMTMNYNWLWRAKHSHCRFNSSVHWFWLHFQAISLPIFAGKHTWFQFHVCKHCEHCLQFRLTGKPFFIDDSSISLAFLAWIGTILPFCSNFQRLDIVSLMIKGIN